MAEARSWKTAAKFDQPKERIAIRRRLFPAGALTAVDRAGHGFARGASADPIADPRDAGRRQGRRRPRIPRVDHAFIELRSSWIDLCRERHVVDPYLLADRRLAPEQTQSLRNPGSEPTGNPDIGVSARRGLSRLAGRGRNLALLGAAAGTVLGIGASIAIAHLAGWPMLVGLDAILLATGSAAAVGVFFGYYPAQRASRLNPIDALRFE